MKIQYKAAAIMTLFGVVIVLLLSLGYDTMRHSIIIEKEMKNIKNISEEVALHLESHLKEKATIARTLSSAPLIKDALRRSNSEFSALPDTEQKQEIDRRNQQWIKTADINDSFIRAHMTNPVAEFLQYQQRMRPEEYGEIFLTNRYGVMIATTGKLTTLAHAHKYWWLACYDDGQGRIFLDDRGFDMSVKGYVLGIVLPIKDGDEIIGILKCNINIMGPLTDLVQEFALRHPGRMQIVRTGGLIVTERDVPPLSTRVDEVLVESLRQKVNGSIIIDENNNNMLVAFYPVEITMGSKKYGFGGNKESIDHIKGNKGEAWHIVLSRSGEDVLEAAHEETIIVIIIGIIFTVLTGVLALFLGKLIAGPIVKLATTARFIGKGNLNARVTVISNDEIGFLAQTLNKMAENLQDTMASRNDLLHEIEQRINAEEEKEKTIVELGKALEEIKTLSGIIPICSHCKEIRDDKGAWNQLEKYIAERSMAQFTHSICDKCMKKYYPE